nr:hypothetical protein [Mycoplasma mycoides]
MLFLTAFDTEIKDNILIIKPKKEYEYKFYNKKQILLKFKDENINTINSDTNNQNELTSSNINQNQQIESRINQTNTTNNSTNNTILKSPYFYMSVAISLLFIICLLFLLNKIVIKYLNKKRKST